MLSLQKQKINSAHDYTDGDTGVRGWQEAWRPSPKVSRSL